MAVIDDSAAVIRIERPWGAIVITNNEVTVESHVDDPPAFRLHSKSGSLGKVSFAYIRPDGSADERVLIQGKNDERTRGREDIAWGELTGHIKGPARYPGDDGMRHRFLFLHDYTWLAGINGEAPTPPVVTFPPPPEPDDVPPIDPRLPQWVAAITAEFEAIIPGIVDPKNAQAVLEGRTSPKEFHDDLAARATTHDPSAHPVGAPY